MAVLAVVAHFLDNNYKNTAVLLGLRRLQGSHSGENMAEIVLDMVSFYNIKDKLGYFILDNATSNDTAVRAILKDHGLGDQYYRRRLRCLGHIINLAAKAFLFGKSIKAFEADDYEDFDAAYKLWQSSGPVGQIHFIQVFIRSSSQRRETFTRLQNGATSLTILDDNKTRWNSTFYMILRALKLREAIDIFCIQYIESGELHKSVKIDKLIWKRLQTICDIMGNFEIATNQLEGSASCGHHGALWECLPTIEMLLSQFEKLRIEYALESSILDPPPPIETRKGTFQAPASKEVADQLIAMAVDNAWEVLNKYYTLTDRSIAYVASVVLNPCHKWRFFEISWKDRPKWLSLAKERVQVLWEEYKQQHKAEVVAPTALIALQKSQPLQDYMEDFYKDEPEEEEVEVDELEAYCALKRQKVPKGDLFLPIEWWKDHRKQFPVLTQLALDLFSIPAMSAEDERVFSSAGKLITADKNRLEIDTIEAIEVLRHAHRRLQEANMEEKRQKEALKALKTVCLPIWD